MQLFTAEQILVVRGWRAMSNPIAGLGTLFVKDGQVFWLNEQSAQQLPS